MDDSSQDRHLPATERKLQQARRDGQAPRSRDLNHLLVLGVGGALLVAFGPWVLARMQNAMALQLRFDAATVGDTAATLNRLGQMSVWGAVASGAFGLTIALLTVLGTIVAGGWVLSTKPLEPQFNRISPLAGFGRLFSMQQLVDVAKLLVTATVMLAITYIFISSNWRQLGHLLMQPSAASLAHAADWVVRGVGWLMLVVLVIAAIDVPVQRFFHARQLRMSHDEIRREHKEADGNPEIKARIRQRQREMAHRSSLKAVPKADLVLMNPTHYAVALKYDDRNMAAPQVIAKGADLLAHRIRDLAQTHQVPVIQAPALARALYAHAELNREVPQALYTAVAQVLAYVYRLRAAWKGQGPAPAQAPNPEVPAELDPHYGGPAVTAPASLDRAPA